MSPNPLLGYSGHTALVWTPVAVCTAIVGLRIWLRARLDNIGSEDHLMTIAWMFQITAAGLTQANIDAANDSLSDQIRSQTQNLYVSISCVISIVCGKLSVGVLLLGLIGYTSRWRRWSVIVSMAILVVLSVVFLPANSLATCVFTGQGSSVAGCMDASVSVGILQTWNFYAVFLDILYSVIPVTFLYRVRISLRKKTSIIALLGLGWIAAVFTILRAVAGYIWGDDSNAATFAHLLANYMEPALVIICGSLATLMPLTDQWSARRSMLGRPADSYQTGPVNELRAPHVQQEKTNIASPRLSDSRRHESVDRLLP